MSVLRVTGKISHTALSAQKWISDAGADDRKVPNNSRVDDGVGPKRRVYSASSAGQLKVPRPLQPYLHTIAYIWNSGSLTIILPTLSLTCS